jgi:hypothetical protein
MAGGDCLQILSQSPSEIYNRYAKQHYARIWRARHGAVCRRSGLCVAGSGKLCPCRCQKAKAKLYIFCGCGRAKGHRGVVVLGLAAPTAICGFGSYPYGIKTVPYTCAKQCVYIPRRVVPSFYIRIREMSSPKIFLLDNYLTHTHNMGVGSLTN